MAFTPWSPGISVSWTVPGVRSALADHERGQFNRSALLADAMDRDDRFSATLDVRIAGVLGLPFSMQSADPESDPANQLAEQLGDSWLTICPEHDVADLLRWYYKLGVGVGELVWETGRDVWTPRLRVHHPQYLWFDETQDCYLLSTEEGTIPITPGDGKWVLLTDGERGYMRGLVRSLATTWMVRTFAWRDWARHSERHGMPIMLAKIPEAALAEGKDEFIEEIKQLATETTIPLPQFGDGEGYDVDLLEAKANDWEGFERLITSCNVSYAVRILGQNLTTEVQGGSYAAATAHERILGDLLRSDAEKIATTLHQQVAVPFVEVNAGQADIAPWPKWDAEPPEDQQQRAQVLATLIPALDNAERLGQSIDTAKLFEQFGIPGVAPEDRKDESGKIFAYHFKYGALTINEARASLGLPPVSGGDKLIQPEAEQRAGAPSGLLSLADADEARDAKAYADGLQYAGDVSDDGVKRHTETLDPFLQKVIAACQNAESEADLERQLLALYGETDPKAGTELARRAKVMTALAGQYAVSAGI